MNELISEDIDDGESNNNDGGDAHQEGKGDHRKQKRTRPRYISLGTIAEDSQRVLSKLNRAYCDDDGRPFADIRIQRALVVHDPFDDPVGMEKLLEWRGVIVESGKGSCGFHDDEHEDNNPLEPDLMEGCPLAPKSPAYERPLEETVPVRIQADDTTLFATAGWDDDGNDRTQEEDDEEDDAARQKRLELQQKQEEEWRKRQDTSRAVMLEMLGDLPSAGQSRCCGMHVIYRMRQFCMGSLISVYCVNPWCCHCSDGFFCIEI